MTSSVAGAPGSVGAGVSAGCGKSAGAEWTSAHILTCWAFPHPLGSHLHSCHAGIKSTNQKPRWLHSSHVVFVSFAAAIFQSFGMSFHFFFNYFIMSEEWHKYAQILEREDQGFRRAMQEEVSIV